MAKKEYIEYSDFEEMFISVRAMFATITGNEVSTNEDQIREVFDQLDHNHNGLIEFEEYHMSMKFNKNLFEWFDVINKGITNQQEPMQIE